MGWLAGKVAGPAFAGLSALLLGAVIYLWLQNGWQEDRIEQLDRALTNARSNLTQCRSNNTTLEAAIEDQNDAIAEAEAEHQATVARLEAVAANARTSAAGAQARADAILNGRGQGDACQNAEDVILGTIE